jgi:hypothetical protein
LKVLLDEDVPRPLSRALQAHEVKTVPGLGWASIKNGALLKLIEAGGFDVFITGDKNMQDQQELRGRSFAVLVLSAISWPIIRNHLAVVGQAVERSARGTIVLVECGVFVNRRGRDDG